MLFHEEICTIIRAEEALHSLRDQHLACVRDALLVGTRVCPREPAPEPSPLPRLLVEALVGSTTWRD